MTNWSKSKTLEFLELARDYPAIWDVNDKSYSNRQMKFDAFNAISEELSIPADDLRDKIESIKSQYNREKRREVKSKETGKGTDQIYKSKWYGMEAAAFLMENNKVRRTVDNMGESDEEANTRNMEVENPRKRKSRCNKFGGKLMEEATDLLQIAKQKLTQPTREQTQTMSNRNTNERDSCSAVEEDKAFCAYLCTILLKIKDPVIKETLKGQITSALNKVAVKELRAINSEQKRKKSVNVIYSSESEDEIQEISFSSVSKTSSPCPRKKKPTYQFEDSVRETEYRSYHRSKINSPTSSIESFYGGDKSPTELLDKSPTELLDKSPTKLLDKLLDKSPTKLMDRSPVKSPGSPEKSPVKAMDKSPVIPSGGKSPAPWNGHNRFERPREPRFHPRFNSNRFGHPGQPFLRPGFRFPPPRPQMRYPAPPFPRWR